MEQGYIHSFAVCLNCSLFSNQVTDIDPYLLYFCLLLIPLGASWKERDVCLLHVGMPGRRDVIQRECLFDSINLGLPGRPLALRLLNLVLYARRAGFWIGSLVRCPNHLILCAGYNDGYSLFSDLAVVDHVSCGLVDRFP